jgi:hypothetical protein|nr:MAG TPA: hypothetical protein [Caudoviricetes sp.]DAZ31566.1 MAG TPA: hypothetical protein [Caudoviricetes sp.]
MNTEQVGYFIKKNMSTILSIGAAIGVVVSNVLTNKASIKATLKIDEVEKKKHRELTFIEEVKVAAPIYAPSIVVGAATIWCIFGSNFLNKKQLAALAGAMSILQANFKRYREEVVHEVGKEKEEDIWKASRTPITKTVSEKESRFADTTGLTFFIDSLTDEGFYTDKATVESAILKLNRKLALSPNQTVTLNQFRNDLELHPTNFGNIVGWSKIDMDENDKTDEWIDIQLVPFENTDGYYIRYLDLPHGLFMETKKEKREAKGWFKDMECSSSMLI